MYLYNYIYILLLYNKQELPGVEPSDLLAFSCPTESYTTDKYIYIYLYIYIYIRSPLNIIVRLFYWSEPGS